MVNSDKSRENLCPLSTLDLSTLVKREAVLYMQQTSYRLLLIRLNRFKIACCSKNIPFFLLGAFLCLKKSLSLWYYSASRLNNSLLGIQFSCSLCPRLCSKGKTSIFSLWVPDRGFRNLSSLPLASVIWRPLCRVLLGPWGSSLPEQKWVWLGGAPPAPYCSSRFCSWSHQPWGVDQLWERKERSLAGNKGREGASGALNYHTQHET